MYLRSVLRRERNDDLAYSIDADTAAGDLELEISPNGSVLERSEKIAPDQLPVPIREALSARGESMKIRKANHLSKAGQQTYQVEVQIDEEQTRFMFGADGELRE